MKNNWAFIICVDVYIPLHLDQTETSKAQIKTKIHPSKKS